MDPPELLLIDQLTKSQVGQDAISRRYDRTIQTPMNFVLDEAERQLSRKFLVYWVDRGLPEIFSLPGFEPVPIVFNSRYIEIVAFIRKLIVDTALAELRLELSERIFLRLIAELCLRHGDPDIATLAFIKSIAGQRVFIQTTNIVPNLELSPIDEAYMALWFFGLAHELGHIASPQKENFTEGFSNEAFERALNAALGAHSYLEELMCRTREKARVEGSDHPLDISRLRSEASADVFATRVLFATTVDIMQRTGRRFRIEHFVAEVGIFLNIVDIIELCRQAATLTPTLRSDPDAHARMAFHPVSAQIRLWVMRKFLVQVMALVLFDSYHPTREQQDRCEKLISDIDDRFKGVMDEIEGGLMRAVSFASCEEGERDLLAFFESSLEPPALGEAKAFCELANSFGVRGDMVQSLERVVSLRSRPEGPVRPRLPG